MTLMLTGIALAALLVAEPLPEDEQKLQEFQERAFFVRELQARMMLSRGSRDIAKECLAEYDAAVGGAEGLGHSVFAFYRASLLVNSGSLVAGTRQFEPLLDHPLLAHDTMYWVLSCIGVGELTLFEDVCWSIPPEKLVRKIVPVLNVPNGVSDWQYRRMEDAIPDRKVLQACLDSVATRYVQMGMRNKAIAALREWIFGRDLPPLAILMDRYGQLSISSTTASHWMTMATLEYEEGSPGLYDDLAVVLIFGAEPEKGRALELLKRIKAGVRPVVAPPAPDALKLKEIAVLYAMARLYPRAFDVLDEWADLLGPEAKTLRQQFSDEWLELAGQYVISYRGSPLFGHEIAGKAEIMKCTIGPPLQQEAVSWVAEIIRQHIAGIILPFGPVVNDDPLRAFETRCVLARKIVYMHNERYWADGADRKKVAEESLRNLHAMQIPQGALGYDFFSFLRCNLLHDAGRDDEAAGGIAKLLESPIFAPLALDLLMRWIPDGKVDYWELTSMQFALSAAIPARELRGDPADNTHWRSGANEENIGELFLQMGLYQEALDAAIRTVQLGGEDGYQEWFDEVPTATCVAAKASYYLGNLNDMANYFAINFVFPYVHSRLPSPNACELLDFLTGIQSGEARRASEAKPDPEKLKMIARFYASWGCYPLAWRLLEKYREVIGGKEVDGLVREYQQQWIPVVKRCADEDSIFMGQSVRTTKECLDIQMPYPCQPDQVRRVAEKVQDTLKAR